MLFCKACGWKQPDDALFCMQCGRPLPPPPSQPLRESNPPTLNAFPFDAPATPPEASQPLPPSDPEEDNSSSTPPIVPLTQQPPTGTPPTVQGTPQLQTVPMVPGSLPSAATAVSILTAGSLAKILIVAAVCATVVIGGIKALPILLPKHPPAPVTVPMPPTQTNCPAQGTARAAVTAPLVLGTHQNFIYTTDRSTDRSDTQSASVLKRYDVSTGRTTDIVKLASPFIAAAQMSADGQWVLFASSVNGQAAIQMIRMDGQGLQTLYCAPRLDPTNSSPKPIYSITWSTDQKMAMFIEEDTSVDNNNPPPLYLLNLAKGTVQKELQTHPGNSTIYYPQGWIDNTHVALLAHDLLSSREQGIYVLDTNKGANQQSSSLQLVIEGCYDFDISPDHTKFFLNSCTAPGTISVLPVTGGSPHTIFTIQNLEVDIIRVISNTTLLVYVGDFAIDTRSGLYKIQMDGTGFTKLFSRDVFGGSFQAPILDFNQSSPYTWSVASRDGRMYSLETAYCGLACQDTLLFGSLSGGKPTDIARGGTMVEAGPSMVGWTTM